MTRRTRSVSCMMGILITLLVGGWTTPRAEAGGFTVLLPSFIPYGDSGTIMQFTHSSLDDELNREELACTYWQADGGEFFSFWGIDRFEHGDRVEVFGLVCRECKTVGKCGVTVYPMVATSAVPIAASTARE